MRFAGKTVVLCVTGGIAAYKAADLTSKLHQNGATVHVLMTESATQFIAPMTFETLSGNRAVVDTFDRSFPWEVEHISLAKAADVFVIAPATANVIAKAAHGIADDMVTTTLLATKALPHHRAGRRPPRLRRQRPRQAAGHAHAPLGHRKGADRAGSGR